MFTFVEKNESDKPRVFVEAMRLNGTLFDVWLMKSWLESAGFKCIPAEDQASLIIDSFFTITPGDWVIYTPEFLGINRMTDDDFVMQYARAVQEV